MYPVVECHMTGRIQSYVICFISILLYHTARYFIDGISSYHTYVIICHITINDLLSCHTFYNMSNIKEYSASVVQSHIFCVYYPQ